MSTLFEQYVGGYELVMLVNFGVSLILGAQVNLNQTIWNCTLILFPHTDSFQTYVNTIDVLITDNWPEHHWKPEWETALHWHTSPACKSTCWLNLDGKLINSWLIYQVMGVSWKLRKKIFPCRNISTGMICTSWKLWGNIFPLKGEQFIF